MMLMRSAIAAAVSAGLLLAMVRFFGGNPRTQVRFWSAFLFSIAFSLVSSTYFSYLHESSTGTRIAIAFLFYTVGIAVFLRAHGVRVARAIGIGGAIATLYLALGVLAAIALLQMVARNL